MYKQGENSADPSQLAPQPVNICIYTVSIAGYIEVRHGDRDNPYTTTFYVLKLWSVFFTSAAHIMQMHSRLDLFHGSKQYGP